MAEADPLTIEVRGYRATVTLCRPDVRNAFNDKTITDLSNVFEALGRRSDLRCIVLAAEGPAFCAGADLNWMKRMAGYSFEENLTDAQRLADMLYKIYACPIPTIARIQGDVFAGGMGLVAACDIAVSVDTARFCLSEVNLGLIPATIGPYVLRAMGARASHRYFLTGEQFDAAQALHVGFVHALSSADQLDTSVDRIANGLLDAGPIAVRKAKEFLQVFSGLTINEQLSARTASLIAEIRGADEGREGVMSFLKKIAPAWRKQPEVI